MTVADTQTKPVGWGSSGPAGSAPSTARPWPAGCRGARLAAIASVDTGQPVRPDTVQQP
jgi:hypothetical protein